MSGEKLGVRARIANVLFEPRELREYQSDVEPRSGNKANEFAHFAGGGTIALALMALGSMSDMRGITANPNFLHEAALQGYITTSMSIMSAFGWMASDILSGAENSAVINSLQSNSTLPARQSRADRRRISVRKPPTRD